MKKTVLIALVCLLTISSAFGQFACSDALKLSKWVSQGKFESDKKAQVDSVLSKYVFDPDGTPTSAFADNPFITGYFRRGTPHSLVSGLAKSIGSSVGGLDVTNLADGLAKFLVKRTKEELNVAFFSKFKETLNNPKYADIRILFPNTWELLDAIGDEIYDYNKYIQNLRDAFLEDLMVLDETLPGIIPNHEAFFTSHFGLAVSLNSACYLTGSLKYGLHPGEIIDQFPLDTYFKKKDDANYFNRNWSGAFQTLQLINESMRDPSSGEAGYWVSFNSVNEMVNNRDAMKLYLGLIYQVAKNERFDSIRYGHGSFIGMLNKVNFDQDYPAFKGYVVNFAMKANELHKLVKNREKPAGDSMAVETYARYFKATVGLFESCTMVCDLPHFKELTDFNLHEQLKTYFKIGYETSDLAVAINRRGYAAAVNHAVMIYNTIRTKPLEKEVADMSVARSPGTPVPQSLKSMQDSLACAQDLLQKLARYGAFISTVATAKTSDDVESAIESAALPSGSSRIKRETPFNVSLNAYTGLFVGYERITGMSQSKFELNNFGVAAPVGVAISTGAHHWSYSAFISLIDIGAIASFRFQNSDSVAQVPTIRLQDIFSPGLFFSIGFPKCPLSFNLGAQVGPNLRSVYVEDSNNPGTYINSYQSNVYWRFSASLVVDIPIFNFYTKSKR
ncbi:MAG: hypothetical protein ACOYNC_10405 [Bacteroidales bacterium]